MKTISILTPCFNAEKYILMTYQSLQHQTYSDWEWIVVDDCSSDNSLKILNDLQDKDSRIKVFNNEINSGAAYTRNKCLENATGEYVAFLDIDDLWDSNKLQLQIKIMVKNNLMFTYHDYYLIQDDGEVIKTKTTPENMTARDLFKFNPFATSSVIIKRELLLRNKIKFLEHLRRRQDYLFWYTVIEKCKTAYRVPGTLSSYRLVEGSNLSSNKKKMAIIQWRLYRDEFKLGFLKSVYYFIHYAIHGIQKYFLK